MPPPTQTVPMWVRCAVCLISSGSVPAMVLAESLGASLTFGVTAAVGTFATCGVFLAFGKAPPKLIARENNVAA